MGSRARRAGFAVSLIIAIMAGIITPIGLLLATLESNVLDFATGASFYSLAGIPLLTFSLIMALVKPAAGTAQQGPAAPNYMLPPDAKL